ncbi:hypothetical protein DFQ27_008138 [Actinomortierella ambigua]|uniref:Uncharacterized protein n=1 Tax=Actinomortierella ambigua TaxID=1343610 RepID=A0A9P6PT83_9FUNG|nr:hypothetical protein DFQ27_008138 [Actinomortierella ambigua]
MANFSPLSRDMTGTIRRKAGPEITLTPREKQVYGTLWLAADVDGNGFITGADAVPFFAKSGLSPQILGQIWVLADVDNKGVLNQQGFSIAVKLIAHAQTGKTPSSALINVDAPLPRFEGLTGAGDTPSATPAAPASSSAVSGSADPPISAEDKAKYGSMFLSCGPVGGLLDGEKAREVFLKSKLPVEKLGQIWNLADTKQRGSLDLTDFTIAMYYIQHTMNGSVKMLPATLPLPVLKACSAPGAGVITSPVLSTQTLPRQVTGGGVSGHLPRQMTGSFGLTSSPLPKQLTGGQVSSSTSAFGLGSASSLPSLDTTWDITTDEKAKYDRFFDQLDKTGSGALGGEEASKFFMNSRLPESVLAQIWDLADITKSGSLSKDEFAVAMYLINRKNAIGTPVPKVLPPTLIPPSLRTRAMLTSGFTEPLRSMNTGSSHTRRQSFDLLGDGPVASHSTGPASTADRETDELQAKITAATGELASLQNQMNNMSQTTGDLQAKRQVLEQQLSALSAQKHEISIRLNQIKTLHENETKSIKDLQATLASLQPQTIKLREELITSERDLVVARSSKDEFLLSVAQDREESEQIKLKLKQNQEETVRLRQELEAMRKDTTRQKNLLEISRRQLAASESEKQRLKDEMDNLDSQVHPRQASSSSSSSSSPFPSHAPPPPAPRGSRKEPPPPPASRGSNFTKASPEMEEAFGIPQALRSPTGSFHDVGAPARAPSITSVSRQSTGTSPFETLSRQTTGTGSSPFEQIARQDTGMSGHGGGGVAKQATGGSGFLDAKHVADTTDIWSPSTHAAHNAAAGGIEISKSPEPMDGATPPLGSFAAGVAATAAVGNDFETSMGSLAAAAVVPLPNSPPMSMTQADPFSVMAFPAMDTAGTPAVTKVDFDSAFQGFSIGGASVGGSGSGGKSSESHGMDGVKSAEAFAEAFPEIEAVTSPKSGGSGDSGNSGRGKRVSAFGFDDDFQASFPTSSSSAATEAIITPTTTGSGSAAAAPVSKRTIKEEEDEFPPIVQLEPQDDEDSSDDEDDEDAFVQASSHVPTPDPASSGVSSMPPQPPQAQEEDEKQEQPPVSTSAAAAAAASGAPRKLTAADFEEFESKFGEVDGFGGADDFDSAFRGVELSTTATSAGAAAKPASSTTTATTSGAGPMSSSKNAFDDSGFDFNMSFDDAFGSSSSATKQQQPAATATGAAAAAVGGSFGDFGFGQPAKPIDLDEAFGGAFGSAHPPSSATAPSSSAPAGGAAVSGFDGFDDGFGAPPTTTTATATTNAPAPVEGSNSSNPPPAVAAPAVDLQGVDELMNLGFSRQQANDALSRYDTVERAANFLFEGGAN